MNRPQTIEIFLPDGSPSSVKIAELTNRVVQVILVPRNKLDYISKRKELKNVGLYFLFDDGNDRSKKVVYIGESEDCLVRLKEHNRKKDFWNYAIAVISKVNGFTKAHVKYLEHLSILETEEVGRYILENKEVPSKVHVTEPMEASLLDSFDTIKILLSALGYPIFDKLIVKPKDLLFIDRVGVKATGEYIDDGFVIFKESEARIQEAISCHKFISTLRIKLLKDGVLRKIDSKKYVFTENYLVSSPSTASNLIIGSSTNGWEKWRNKDGKTLDELKRS